MELSAADIATLSHAPTPAVAQGHHQWWRSWRQRVGALSPRLRPAEGDEGTGGVTHVFESLGGVRIGGRLIEGEGGRGGVVLLHGYSAREDLDNRTPYARAGLSVLKLRVRGFPGSQLDTGPLCDAPGGWIAHKLDDSEQATLIGGVADVVLAARALRAHIGGAPVGVRGDSLGGGLAVLAAAQAAEDIARLAVGVPSLGDWTFRLLGNAPGGAGRDAARAIEAAGEKQGALRRTLRLSDSAVHARRVQQPVLCLLATHDDVLPPPAAAAVYNALASDPGLKRRVLIERGHAPPSRADAERLVAFERRAVRFLNTRNDALSALTS